MYQYMLYNDVLPTYYTRQMTQTLYECIYIDIYSIANNSIVYLLWKKV